MSLIADRNSLGRILVRLAVPPENRRSVLYVRYRCGCSNGIHGSGGLGRADFLESRANDPPRRRSLCRRHSGATGFPEPSAPKPLRSRPVYLCVFADDTATPSPVYGCTGMVARATLRVRSVLWISAGTLGGFSNGRGVGAQVVGPDAAHHCILPGTGHRRHDPQRKYRIPSVWSRPGCIRAGMEARPLVLVLRRG